MRPQSRPCLSPLTAAELQHQTDKACGYKNPDFSSLSCNPAPFTESPANPGASPREVLYTHVQNFLFNFKEQWPPRLGTWELAGALPGHDHEVGVPPVVFRPPPPPTQCPYSLQSGPPFLELFPQWDRKQRSGSGVRPPHLSGGGRKRVGALNRPHGAVSHTLGAQTIPGQKGWAIGG